MRDIKWHIYNEEHEPLCWDGKALEFDSKEDAEKFLNSSISNSFNPEDFYKDVRIVKDILYYDDKYLNATGYIINDGEELVSIDNGV